MNALSGVRIIESSVLPLVPSDGENARRIVRHGLADVLRWLGEEPGRKPGEETHAVMISGDLHASRDFVSIVRATRA